MKTKIYTISVVNPSIQEFSNIPILNICYATGSRFKNTIAPDPDPELGNSKARIRIHSPFKKDPSYRSSL